MSAAMRCPYCGSDDVECVVENREHAHQCHACGACDRYHGPAKRKPHDEATAAAMGWGPS